MAGVQDQVLEGDALLQHLVVVLLAEVRHVDGCLDPGLLPAILHDEGVQGLAFLDFVSIDELD